MKKLSIVLLVLIFTTCNYTFAQTANITSASSTYTSKEEQELYSIFQQLVDADKRGDRKVFDRYLAENYIETNEKGVVMTKAQSLDNIHPFVDSLQQHENIDDFKIQAYGNTVVTNYRVTIDYKLNGQQKTDVYRSTAVFIKQNGQWKIITGHYSKLPDGKADA